MTHNKCFKCKETRYLEICHGCGVYYCELHCGNFNGCDECAPIDKKPTDDNEPIK